MKSENFVKFVYISIRQLYSCDVTDISTVASWEGDMQEINQNFEKS